MTETAFFERLARIRDAFWQWDPIGVADYRSANDDEYDAYIGRYLGLRASGVPVSVAAEEVASMLQRMTEMGDVDTDRLIELLESADQP